MTGPRTPLATILGEWALAAVIAGAIAAAALLLA